VPIAKQIKPIRKRRKVKKSSLRYVVINGEYRRYPDGRLVAQNTPKGREWYWMQTLLMADRQEWICGICHSDTTMNCWARNGVTFQHGDGRGMAGARRTDDINAPGNCAAHWDCNSQLGSKRISNQ
jgi:hypothetical protein